MKASHTKHDRFALWAFNCFSASAGLPILLVGIAWLVPKLADRSGSGPAPNQADIATLSDAVEEFRRDSGGYPTTEEGINALLRRKHAEQGGSRLRGPYIQGLPRDTWGRTYEYIFIPPGDYRIWSRGPDGTGTGEDTDSNLVRDSRYPMHTGKTD